MRLEREPARVRGPIDPQPLRLDPRPGSPHAPIYRIGRAILWGAIGLGWLYTLTHLLSAIVGHTDLGAMQ